MGLGVLALAAVMALAGDAEPSPAPALADLVIEDVFLAAGAGGGGKGAPELLGGPSIAVVANTTVLFALEKFPTRNPHVSIFETVFRTSRDSGGHWVDGRLPDAGGFPFSSSAASGQVLVAPSGLLVVQSNCSGSRVAWSRDAGASWSHPAPMTINGSKFGPHYAGLGVGHGFEIRAGRHRGRLVLPREQICGNGQPDRLQVFVLYSDDGGTTWMTGALLAGPQPAVYGWGEPTLAEMRNGSLLLAGRLVPMPGSAPPPLDQRHLRGFARSDDGGASWAASWFVDNAAVHTTTCAQGIARSYASGALYWGTPGARNHSRTNYTVLRSLNDGASWDLLGVVYPGGAGYSDLHVLPPSAGPGDRLGVAFQRTLWEAGVEGGGYNLAWATMRVAEPVLVI
eukprot:COSAG01_NODE_645_length_14553_cov_32.925227_12_plen_397_part_00